MKHGTSFLRIVKRLSLISSLSHDNVIEETGVAAEDEEIDTEALVRPVISSTARVQYDIVHSVSYQVPVLYITFKNLPADYRMSVDIVYNLLVPVQYKQQIRIVGIMGALSMTEHPVTGVPAYFVHPCRTAEAMGDIVRGQSIEPARYLMLWVGMIGSSVGLHVPTTLVSGITSKISGTCGG